LVDARRRNCATGLKYPLADPTEYLDKGMRADWAAPQRRNPAIMVEYWFGRFLDLTRGGEHYPARSD
jgi:hypothetical protein